MTLRRRPRAVYGDGSEPDPRSSLSNERTALAGLRTSLGLVVAGVALGALAHLTDDPDWFRVIAIVLCIGGGVLSIATYRRWMSVEQALRRAEPVPAPMMLPPLALAITVLAVAVGIGLFLSSVG